MSFRADEMARELAALRERMNRLFDESLASGHTGGPAWVPPADVYRAGRRIVITLELPGVDDEAIEVASEGRTLRVRGHRAAAKAGELGALQLERSYGVFEREFTLPAGARPERSERQLENGVLCIEIPIG